MPKKIKCRNCVKVVNALWLAHETLSITARDFGSGAICDVLQEVRSALGLTPEGFDPGLEEESK